MAKYTVQFVFTFGARNSICLPCSVGSSLGSALGEMWKDSSKDNTLAFVSVICL